MQYKDGDRVMQLKHFTPLYLTSSPVYSTDLSSDCNGTLDGINNTQSNGYALFPLPLNGLRSQNSLAIDSASDIASSLNFPHANGSSFDIEDMDNGVIASKSSGSVTKFSTRQANGTISRKPSNGEDQNSVCMISGSSLDHPQVGGIDLNSSMEILAEEARDGYYEYGEDGQMYACHYV